MKQKGATLITGGFASATGEIQYGFTNDYMFRAVLQRNKKVLKSLICSLLHLKPEEIRSVEITNPIELSKHKDAKDFILDIRMLLNNNTVLNLEMQIQDRGNWTERSLSYLCRTFDNLNSGDDYKKVTPAIHIGFLNYTPFPEFPEFYATYKMMNVKNHHLYSGKFTLGMINLTQINLATDEDRLWETDSWARLFKATTWEEIRMIAHKNEAMMEAAETLYHMHCDETIRDMARARQDQLRWENWVNRTMAEQEAALAEQAAALAEKDAALAKKDAALAERDAALAEKDATLAERDAEIAALKKLTKM